jgi:hypothetical protein
MSDLLSRLRAQQDWLVAIRDAEKSGDLSVFAALLRSGAEMGWSRYFLADLLDAHRLVRKKRGAWRSIFEPSAQTKYADAVKAVRSWRATARLTGDRRDPVECVARKSGLDPEKLLNVMQGKTGFGRGSKSKPGPDPERLRREMGLFLAVPPTDQPRHSRPHVRKQKPT